MPICPSCHREIASPGKFCPECGASWPRGAAAASAEGATIASMVSYSLAVSFLQATQF